MCDEDLFAEYQKSAKEESGDMGKAPNDGGSLPPLVPSAHMITDLAKLYFVKQRISHLWGLPGGARKYNPSPNPVSLERRDLVTLKKNNYVVAEKSDGVQYLLLLDTWAADMCLPCSGLPLAVMVNRNYDVFEVRVMAQSNFFKGSLFIGELVWEHEAHLTSGMPRQLFLVFDMPALGGQSYAGVPNYMTRYMHIVGLFSTPGQDITKNPKKWSETCEQLAEAGKIVCEGNQYALAFRQKPCASLSGLKNLWEKHRKLRHNSDGLIFTPVECPIGVGTQYNLFKWKPHNTLDFEVKGTYDLETKQWECWVWYRKDGVLVDGSQHGLFLPKEFDKDDERVEFVELPLVLVPNEYMLKVFGHFEKRNQSEFHIVMECSCKLPDASEWSEVVPMIQCIPQRVRSDKKFSNDRSTIDRTLVNIQENITILELCKVVTQIESNY